MIAKMAESWNNNDRKWNDSDGISILFNNRLRQIYSQWAILGRLDHCITTKILIISLKNLPSSTLRTTIYDSRRLLCNSVVMRLCHGLLTKVQSWAMTSGVLQAWVENRTLSFTWMTSRSFVFCAGCCLHLKNPYCVEDAQTGKILRFRTLIVVSSSRKNAKVK